MRYAVGLTRARTKTGAGQARQELRGEEILRQQWNCVCKFHVVTSGNSGMAEIIKVECTRKKNWEKIRDRASCSCSRSCAVVVVIPVSLVLFVYCQLGSFLLFFCCFRFLFFRNHHSALVLRPYAKQCHQLLWLLLWSLHCKCATMSATLTATCQKMSQQLQRTSSNRNSSSNGKRFGFALA